MMFFVCFSDDGGDGSNKEKTEWRKEGERTQVK